MTRYKVQVSVVVDDIPGYYAEASPSGMADPADKVLAALTDGVEMYDLPFYSVVIDDVNLEVPV